MQEVTVFTKADSGKLSKIIDYGADKRIEIPINKDGSVRWYKDKIKEETKSQQK